LDKNVKRLGLAALILVSLGIALGAFLGREEDSEVRLTGIVSANEAFVASELSGRLKELRVSEGDWVQNGQVVAVLATDEIDALRQSQLATVDQLTARVDQGRERVHLERERVKSQIDSAAAQRSAAESQREEVRAELDQARKELERAAELFAQDSFRTTVWSAGRRWSKSPRPSSRPPRTSSRRRGRARDTAPAAARCE
jgi:multidrug efflux pump subunit AcrA (membrane-fusion protein)